MKRYYDDDGFNLYPDPTRGGGKVQFDPTHERIINTSPDEFIESIVSVDDQDVRIISLFAREKYEDVIRSKRGNIVRADVDGNPVIYALKEIYGWSFVTPENRRAFMDQVVKVSQSLDETYDLLVIIPSRVRKPGGKSLNSEIADILKGKAQKVMENTLEKKPLGDVITEEIDWDGLLVLEGERVVEELQRDISNMVDFFDMKEVTQRTRILPYIHNIFRKRADLQKTDPLIRGKNILVIDDTITSGGSITFGVRTLLEFDPKSITVLTVFSARIAPPKEIADYYSYYDNSKQVWSSRYDDPDYDLLD